MYQKHFQFKRKPFEQLPDPAFLFLTDQHDEALTRMQFALAINDSLMIITGEVGSGKTTLVRKLLSEMSTDLTLAFITHTRVTDVELLQSILAEFGVRPFEMGKIELLIELRRFIDLQHAEGKRVVIIVDEAQNLGVDTLEELRLLTCLDSAEEKALNIILIGQPQLSQLIDSSDLEQLRQRCRLRFHLHRLSEKQTSGYIQHRMRIAMGRDTSIIDVLAERLIYENARGIPRLINTLCDTALMMACLADKQEVGKAEIDEALAELGWSVADTGAFPVYSDGESEFRWRATLTLVKDNQAIGDYDLQESSYIIGRADDCGIHINSKYLSRHHALISRVGSDWTISDLRSTNGVRVNGKRAQVRKLDNGDVIAIGVHHLLFRLREEQPVPLDLGTKNLSSSELAETFVIVDDKVIGGSED
jgi:type II secretory pathway predicted ATPase ExeA